MAGFANYVYKDDKSFSWGVKKKGDWASNAASGFAKVTTSTGGVTPLPRGYKMRYVYAWAVKSGVQYRRKFECGTPTAAAYKEGGTFTHEGVQWFVTGGIYGEKRVKLGPVDTGVPG